jgi:hypothetical protein
MAPATLQAWLTVIIAAGGALGTLLLLIVNLKVGQAVSDVKVDVANMRAETAHDRAEFYRQLMDTMSKTFVSRDAWQTAHDANLRRFDGVDETLHRIDQRIADIG